MPSHIIAPIIHKTKEQVAETFRRELQATEADVADIPQMTAFARRMLRAEFLAADMGISGVNFARRRDRQPLPRRPTRATAG